jgi:chromosome condensin MukBEF complex kleisin-like MukF subunit
MDRHDEMSDETAGTQHTKAVALMVQEPPLSRWEGEEEEGRLRRPTPVSIGLKEEIQKEDVEHIGSYVCTSILAQTF